MRTKYLKPVFAAPVPGRSAACTPSLVIAGLVISLLTTSCATTKAPPTPSPFASLPQKTINATGYGTVEKSDRYSRSQIKLMAMRASKMDAYRSLAEQLNGMQMRGQTTVEDMEVNHDSYQIYLNAYLRGARVKRTSAIGSDAFAGDDTFETVVELDLTPRFYECINGSKELISQCLQQNPEAPTPSFDRNSPAPSSVSMPSTVSAPPTVSSAAVSSVSSGCNTNDCYGYPKTKGFSRK